MNPSNRSHVPWWLKAAVYLMFGLCLAMGAVLVLGVVRGRKQYTALMERLEKAGYEKVTGSAVVVSNRPTKPTWYQPGIPESNAAPASVELLNGSDASVAIFAATGLVRGVVNGDLLFVGRTLILESDCVVTGNIETTCWMLQQFGRFEGQLLGTRNYHTTNRAAVGMMK